MFGVQSVFDFLLMQYPNPTFFQNLLLIQCLNWDYLNV